MKEISLFLLILLGLIAGLAYMSFKTMQETNSKSYINDDLEDEDIHNEYF